VGYGIELLAGLRPGESAALRWRHYDATVTPLGKLLIATAYSTKRNVTKGTKTETVKHIPVHPTLAGTRRSDHPDATGGRRAANDPCRRRADPHLLLLRAALARRRSPRAGGTDGITTCAPPSSRSRSKTAPIRT